MRLIRRYLFGTGIAAQWRPQHAVQRHVVGSTPAHPALVVPALGLGLGQKRLDAVEFLYPFAVAGHVLCCALLLIRSGVAAFAINVERKVSHPEYAIDSRRTFDHQGHQSRSACVFRIHFDVEQGRSEMLPLRELMLTMPSDAVRRNVDVGGADMGRGSLPRFRAVELSGIPDSAIDSRQHWRCRYHFGLSNTGPTSPEFPRHEASAEESGDKRFTPSSQADAAI